MTTDTPINWLNYSITLVTLGRLTDVSLNKNGGPRVAVKNKGSVWVEGERIRSPFLTRRKITQKPNHSRHKFSLHLIFFEIFEIQNPANWGLLNREETKSEAYWNISWGLLSLRRRHLAIFTARKLENLVHNSSERNNVLNNSNVFQFWLFSSLISALMLFILHDEYTNNVVSKQIRIYNDKIRKIGWLGRYCFNNVID